MPETDGYMALARLKQGRHAEIPVIFLSGVCDKESQRHGLELGAIDYVQKPFSPGVLRERVERQLGLRGHRV
jgi:putative two-component system response regulator